jgi:hypothetical protein
MDYALASEPSTSKYTDVNRNQVITPNSTILFTCIGSDSSSSNFGFALMVKNLIKHMESESLLTQHIHHLKYKTNNFIIFNLKK